MAGLVYAGKFEQLINAMLGPKNIAATAKKFAKLEQQYGPYTFGKFVKHLLQRPDEFANWDQDAGGISEAVRGRLTEIISTNLRSAKPMPMLLKVGDNVDATHDLIVKVFAHNRTIYIGLHMLCPNPGLK